MSQQRTLYGFLAWLCGKHGTSPRAVAMIAELMASVEGLASMRSDDPACDGAGQHLMRLARNILSFAEQHHTRDELRGKVSDALLALRGGTASPLQCWNMARSLMVELRTGLAQDFGESVVRLMFVDDCNEEKQRELHGRLVELCAAMLEFARFDEGNDTSLFEKRRGTVRRRSRDFFEATRFVDNAWKEYGQVLTFRIWGASRESIPSVHLHKLVLEIVPTAAKIVPAAAAVA